MAVIYKYHLQKREHHTAIYNLSYRSRSNATEQIYSSFAMQNPYAQL
jgi:hypothetical protein